MSREFPPGKDRKDLPAPSMAVDYYSVLSRVIDSSKGDPAQLRKVIYELARWNLKSDIWAQYPPLNKSEIRDHISALEMAIARFERDSSQEDAVRKQQAPMQALEKIRAAIERDASLSKQLVDASRAPRKDNGGKSANAVVVVDEKRRAPGSEVLLAPSDLRQQTAQDSPLGGRAWIWMVVWPVVNLATVAVLGWVIYASIANILDRVEVLKSPARPNTEQAEPAQPTQGRVDEPSSEAKAADRETFPFPVPATPGVFSLSNGELQELEQLPVSVPDPRTLLSAEITKPAHTVLPDGKPVFIIYRRGLANNQPQRAVVRVVAQVMRAVAFPSGKASTTTVEGVWHVRNQSYDFKIEPLGRRGDMIMLRPEQADLVLSAGRYALVIGQQGYDFSVQGPVTQSVHCLERFQSATGPLYSECRDQ